MTEAVIISWPHDIDDPYATEIVGLSTDNMPIKGIRTENELWAANEWIIPTTFVVTVTGLFFKSFFEEAGKDAYQTLKKHLKEYLTKRRQIKTQLIASDQSPNKLSKNYDQSFSISLKARLHTGALVNVLFSNKVKDEDIPEMLEGMFQSLELMYQNCHKYAPEENINDEKRPNEVYLVVDIKTKRWEILSPKEMSDRYRNT